ARSCWFVPGLVAPEGQRPAGPDSGVRQGRTLNPSWSAPPAPGARSWSGTGRRASRLRPRKEAARQSATDAGPQAFYVELALARLKRWGGTSSVGCANPRWLIANSSSFDNGESGACPGPDGNFHHRCQSDVSAFTL